MCIECERELAVLLPVGVPWRLIGLPLPGQGAFAPLAPPEGPVGVRSRLPVLLALG